MVASVAPIAAAGDVVAPIGDARWRHRVCVRGHVRSTRLQPSADGVPSWECTLVDDTGGITIVFLGRTHVAGIHLGTELEVEGMVGERRERLIVLNPVYRLLA